MAVERPAVDQLEVEVGRTLEDRVHPGLTGDHREERHLDAVDQTSGHQRPVHRQAPGERNGTSDSSLSRATTSAASPLTRVASGQLRGPSSVVDTTVVGRFLIRVFTGVTHLGLLGARAQHLQELPKGVGSEDHPLLLAVQGKSAVEELGALLTALSMSDAQREMLGKLAVSQTAPVRQVQRARVLVLAGQGAANCRIAEQVGVTVSTVRAWRDRFAVEGVAKLGAVRAGRGRKAVIPQATIEQSCI